MLLHIDLNVRESFGTLNFLFNGFVSGHAHLMKGFLTHLSMKFTPELYAMPLKLHFVDRVLWKFLSRVWNQVTWRASPFQNFDSNSLWPTFKNSLFLLFANFCCTSHLCLLLPTACFHSCFDALYWASPVTRSTNPWNTDPIHSSS